MRRLLLLGCALICAAWFFAVPCFAHDPQLSALKIIRTAKQSAVVSVSTHISKLHAPNLDAAIRARLKLRLDGHAFAPQKATVIRDLANDFMTWQAPYHGSAAKIEVLAPLYPEDPTSRFTVAVFENGRITQQALLDDVQPSVAFGAGENAAARRASTLQVIGAFVRTGVLHIFGGLDHICFILGLLLLGGSLKVLLKTVTAFTLAHSLTLSLSALHIWTPSPRFIEPLIALSIVAVAAENLRPRGGEESTAVARDWRPWLAFGFGLFHGFGFAGALGEIGLPRAALVPALAAFNVGVEIGQAAIVLCAAPLLAVLATKSLLAYRRLVTTGSCAIALAGALWFVQRAFGV
jgi:hypothetical protein